MIKYSVCIATYKRSELLKKLMDSLLAQKNIDMCQVEIIVIDNDFEGGAQTAVEDYYGKSECSIYYDIQPEKNISLTRNLAVIKASGEYIFFIDDDEYADENWMAIHLENLKKYSVDGAFGRVESYFSRNAPEWIKNCYVYYRKTNPSGQPPANLNTGNCIIKSEYFLQKNYRFDPEYGLTGGSDFQLFSKMITEGVNFASCYEAITYEFVPDSRANIKWLIKRVSRTGNNFTRTLINQSSKQSIMLSISEFLIGVVQAIIALLISVFFLWNRTKSLNWFLKSVSNISKPLAVLGIYPEEYKNG